MHHRVHLQDLAEGGARVQWQDLLAKLGVLQSRRELHTVATATVGYSHRPLSPKRLSQVKADVYRFERS
jgi:hypothetical protein